MAELLRGSQELQAFPPPPLFERVLGNHAGGVCAVPGPEETDTFHPGQGHGVTTQYQVPKLEEEVWWGGRVGEEGGVG